MASTSSALHDSEMDSRPQQNPLLTDEEIRLPTTIIDSNDDCGLMEAVIGNNVILSEIFSHLSARDIYHCRAVCVRWHKIASLEKFLTTVTENIVISFGGAIGDPAVPNFLEMMDKSELRFQKFHLKNLSVKDPSVKEFFRRFGSSIKSLGLNYFDLPRTEDRGGWTACNYVDAMTSGLCPMKSWDLQYILLEGAPFLEELILTDLTGNMKAFGIFDNQRKCAAAVPQLKLRRLAICFNSQRVYYQPFFDDLMKASPALEEIHVESIRVCCKQETTLLLNSIVTVSGSRVIQNLTTLDLPAVGQSTVNSLKTHFCSAQLRRFTVESVDHLGGRKLEVFLASQRGTLEHLSLKFNCDGNISLLAVMPKIKYLELDIFGEIRSIGTLNYAVQFPNLESLKLPRGKNLSYRCNPEEWFSPQSPCSSLRYLSLPGNLENSEILIRISQIFPNVSKLYLPAQQHNVVRSLWTVWPNLKILAICLSSTNPTAVSNEKTFWETDHPSVIDSLFSGIPESHCKRLKDKFYSEGFKFDDEEMADFEKLRTGPSILNMKGLKRLIIHGAPDLNIFFPMDKEHVITDVTGYMTFLKLTNLIDIDMRFAANKLSSKCKTRICSTLDLSCHKNPVWLRFENSLSSEFQKPAKFTIDDLC